MNMPMGERRNGSLTVDRLLMIFDMRYLKKTTPLQLGIDPIFLRFIPTFSNRICVVSQVHFNCSKAYDTSESQSVKVAC